MASEPTTVCLIPGFFGFANLGEQRYFEHVRPALDEALRRQGVAAAFLDVKVRPTASLRRRALGVARAIDEHAPAGPILLIGHSTGGLDARLLVAPGVDLGDEYDAEPVARRVSAVVTVCTPHRGTPLAYAFGTPAGRQLLQLLSLITIHVVRDEKLPPTVVRRLAETLVQLDRGVASSGPTLDQVFRALLQSLEPGRQRALEEFFDGVSEEQALLPQLVPEALELLDSSLQDRAEVRTGCVVSRARPPRLASMASFGFDPYAQSMYALYRWLHGRATAYRAPTRLRWTPDEREALLAAFGEEPASSDSDGIVPVASQVWGDVIHVARADHFDVLGYFDDPAGGSAHNDWLPSASRFDPVMFRRLWTDVARFLST